MRLFFGLLLILIGVLTLGSNLELWRDLNLNYVWHFWPLVLVVFGVALIVRNLKYGWAIILLVFVASVGLVYALSQNKTISERIATDNGGPREEKFSEDMPGGATKGTISLETGAAEVKVSSTNDQLIKGTLNSSFFEPVLKVDKQNSNVSVDLSMENNARWDDWNKAKNELNVELTNRIPLELKLDTGASKMNLDLSNIILSGLTLKAGATSVDLKIGDNVLDGADITLKVGASSVNITVPENLGVKAEVKSGLSSKELEGFKNLGEGKYESDNYSSATKKINIFVDAGVSSITINRD